MAWARNSLRRLKDPDYTGQNRCLPCTAVNVAIAFAAALAVKIGTIAAGAGSGLALLFAEALFVLAVAVIYLRGYLVPGTPALTGRYLPPWLLDAFGKGTPPAGFTGRGGSNRESETDVDSELVEAGALTEANETESLRLTAEFRRAVRETIDSFDESADRRGTLDLLDAATGEVRFEEYGDAFRAFFDGALVGTWESRQAFRADVCAGAVLRERVDHWDEATASERGQFLGGVRRRLETCTDCGDDLSTETYTIETCCSRCEVTTLACESCETRVFESRTSI